MAMTEIPQRWREKCPLITGEGFKRLQSIRQHPHAPAWQFEIGDRVTSSGALQVLAFDSVVIEEDVMFASNVFVADGTHAYATADVPYKYQGVGPLGPVRIGRGSWIGQNVVILPGVTIGALCIIGANSVVVGDVPARTIAVGAPARVIRRWSVEDERWERIAAHPAG